MILTANLSTFPLGVRQRAKDIFQNEEMAQRALAEVEQAKITQFYRNAVGPGTTKDGYGPLSIAMHKFYASWFKHTYGENWAQDADLVKWILKNDERFRVPEAGTRIQSGWTGFSKRFSKVYQ